MLNESISNYIGFEEGEAEKIIEKLQYEVHTEFYKGLTPFQAEVYNRLKNLIEGGFARQEKVSLAIFLNGNILPCYWGCYSNEISTYDDNFSELFQVAIKLGNFAQKNIELHLENTKLVEKYGIAAPFKNVYCCWGERRMYASSIKFDEEYENSEKSEYLVEDFKSLAGVSEIISRNLYKLSRINSRFELEMSIKQELGDLKGRWYLEEKKYYDYRSDKNKSFDLVWISLIQQLSRK